MKQEIWLPVIGYKGYFQVSNTQKIRSLPRVVKRKDGTIQTFMGKELKIYVGSKGYKRIGLCKKGVTETYLFHRIVAASFILRKNIPKNKCVNHKDGDKLNCDPDNLEVVSYSENLIHAHKNGLNKNIGATHTQARLTTEDITLIRQLNREGVGRIKLSRQFNTPRSTIQGILNFRRRKTG